MILLHTMKEKPYHIFINFSVVRLCAAAAFFIIFSLTALFIPANLKAQDAEDSVEVYSDSANVSATGDEYQNKAGKFPGEAVFRSVPDTTVDRMKKEKEFAYANDPAYWVKAKKAHKKSFVDYTFDFFQSDVVKWLFRICLAGLIIFVVYRIIVVNNLLIFYSSKKNKKNIEDAAMNDVDPLVIDQKIHEAIDQKNFNMAVRYLYIKTLYALNEKKWIQFHTQATNNEYLNQMSQHKMSKEFNFLTQVYEYVWYGKFEITEQQFLMVHHNFKNFQAAV